MKKKIFNLLKLFVLVLALFISFIGMKLNVFAAQSEFVGEPSFIPVHVVGTPSNNESVLVSLKGATVTVPDGWTATAGYGEFNVSGSLTSDYYGTFDFVSLSIGFTYVGFLDSYGDSIVLQNNTAPLIQNMDSGHSFSFSFIGGDDATNQSLIQFFVDNNATITGGVYSDDVVSVTNDIGETKLVWELKWLESTEEIPNDYVEIYSSSDTKQCYIVFKKLFSIPMELLVKIEGDETVYASCDVDCYERTETITDTSLSVSIDGSTNFDLLLGQDVEENEITFNGNTTFESIFENQKVELNSMTCVPVTKGTLGTTQEISYKIGLSEELQSLLESRNITFISSTSSLITTTVKGLLESLITFNADNKEIIYEALNTTENWFRIDVEVVDKYHDETINEYLYMIDIIGFMIDDYYSTSIIPTDLTGYTVTVPSGWSANAGYGQFSINGNFTNRGDFIGIWIGSNKSGGGTDGRVCFVSPSYPEMGSPVNFALDNSNQFLLTITGGTDVANQSLIQWFVDNGATFSKEEVPNYEKYFYVKRNNDNMQWQFALPEDNISFRTLISTYGTLSGSTYVYYDVNNSTSLYCSPYDITNGSIFYFIMSTGGGQSLGNVSLDSIISNNDIFTFTFYGGGN